uniref:Uncharacterized protein n=1 Tax=Chenopodium quinoa TaxID=63459 RepID=A0A803LLU8_CHEQI
MKKVWRPKVVQGVSKEVPELEKTSENVLKTRDPIFVTTGNVPIVKESLSDDAAPKKGVNIVFAGPQIIHTKVINKTLQKGFDCSFLYGSNDADVRKELWNQLGYFASICTDPWIVTGDFSCPLNADDRIGRQISFGEMRPFKDSVESCGLQDMIQVSAKFTWTNKHQGDARVYSKIDRTLINSKWFTDFPGSYVHYNLELWFDNCLAIILFEEQVRSGPKPFKFFDMWDSNLAFDELVRDAWSFRVFGKRMFQDVKKLKQVKAALKGLNKSESSEVGARFIAVKDELIDIQKADYE